MLDRTEKSREWLGTARESTAGVMPDNQQICSQGYVTPIATSSRGREG